jgi:hypothetical protein
MSNVNIGVSAFVCAANLVGSGIFDKLGTLLKKE